MLAPMPNSGREKNYNTRNNETNAILLLECLHYILTYYLVLRYTLTVLQRLDLTVQPTTVVLSTMYSYNQKARVFLFGEVN